jgi:hypothetical protein
VNQGPSGEPAAQVFVSNPLTSLSDFSGLQVQATPGEEEGPDPQLVEAELQGARDGKESMRLLGGHATSMVSAANNAPADLAAAGNFETTYLRPLNIINNALKEISDVWTILVD